MTNSAWFFLATPDVLTAQLLSQRSASFAPEDLEATSAPRVATEPRRLAPLFRRLRTAAA